jgi:hypothetical protein
MHGQMTPLTQALVALCDAYDSTGDRSLIAAAIRLLEAEGERPAGSEGSQVTAARRGDPAAVQGRDRAQRFFRVYGGEGAHEAADARDGAAAARMRRERLAVDEVAAFCAPLVIDSTGRAL